MKKITFLRETWPCSPAAEAALQPPDLFFRDYFPMCPLLRRSVFFFTGVLRSRGAAAIFRKEPVRFDSFRFRNFRTKSRFGSVRKITVPGSTRFGLHFLGCVVARSCSVRLVSASSSGWFQNSPATRKHGWSKHGSSITH